MVNPFSSPVSEEDTQQHLISPADREHTGKNSNVSSVSASPIPEAVSLLPSQQRQLKREQRRLEKEQKKLEKRLQKEEKKRRKQEEKERRNKKKEEKSSKSPKKSSTSLRKKKSKTPTDDTQLSSSPSTAPTTVSPASLEASPQLCCHEEDLQEEEEIFAFDGSEAEEESSDEGDFVGNFEFSDSSNTKDFVCLSPDDIFNEHAALVDDVVEILSVSQTVATTLLKHHKWNKDRLLIAYFENPRKVLEAAGVSPEQVHLPSTSPSPLLSQKQADEEYGMCTVCTEDMNGENSFSLACGHRFCNDCWAGHLTTKVHEGESMGILCPSYDCPLVVDESIIRQLVSASVYQKYVQLLLNSFITNNERVKWCPAPGCGKAISGEMSKSQWVKCICGYRFCFECSNETHAPATCEHVRLWQQKMNDESETQNWISANTVDCPKCKCFIEKNGGCNHMTCRQCGHEFCWLCLRDWKGHNDFYTCNRYLKSQKKSEKKKAKKSKKAKSRDQKELHRQALERYLHFYSRYLNHDKSRTAEKVREEAHNKMRQLQETEATMAEVKFIAAAAEKLQECRLALKYSYVVGYYLPEGPSSSKALFEYLQENLEKTTEQLTEVLEHGAEDRVRVIDLTKLIESRLNNFLEWQFEESTSSSSSSGK